MKKFVPLLLVFILTMAFVTCFADGNNDLKLGMSEEDVISVMGGTGKVGNLATSFTGMLTVHFYENQKISIYDDATLNLFFMDGKLVSKLYGFKTDPNANRYEYLLKALQQKYGESSENYDIASEMLELYGMGPIIEKYGAEVLLGLLGAKLATWTAEDGSHITLLYLKNDGKGVTSLNYISSLTDIQIEYDDSDL